MSSTSLRRVAGKAAAAAGSSRFMFSSVQPCVARSFVSSASAALGSRARFAIREDRSIGRFSSRPPEASFSTLHSPDGSVQIKPAPSGEGIHLHLSSGDKQNSQPTFISYAWLLDTDQSSKSIHPSTQQKFYHSSDAIEAVTSALQKAKEMGRSTILAEGQEEGARIEADPETRKATLVLRFDGEQVKLENRFSKTFCSPSSDSSSASSSSSPLEARITLDTIMAHAFPSAYDDWLSDVLGVAKPWTAKTLGVASPPSPLSTVSAHPAPRLNDASSKGYQKEKEPFITDWSAISPSTQELQANYEATMLALPEAAADPQRLESLYALVHTLLRDGLGFVTNVPTSSTGSVPNSSQPSSVATLYHLSRLLGELRSTLYGTNLWDVRSMKQSKNIAYTNSDLGFHADLCYFQNPPRFQFLHMLKNQVKGGKSLFVDGFAIAEELWRTKRDEFIALATTPVAFHYNNDGRYYRFAHPTIEIAQPFQGFASASTAQFPRYPAGITQPSSEDVAQEPMPRLVAINYSPPFQAPLPMHPPSQLQSTAMGMSDSSESGSGADSALFRKALTTFAELTHDPRFTYVRQMSEGECVIFDNRRVLHSRTGFEWNEEEEASGEEKTGSEVKRWLKGSYVEGDAVWSTYRVLRARVEAARG